MSLFSRKEEQHGFELAISRMLEVVDRQANGEDASFVLGQMSLEQLKNMRLFIDSFSYFPEKENTQ